MSPVGNFTPLSGTGAVLGEKRVQRPPEGQFWVFLGSVREGVQKYYAGDIGSLILSGFRNFSDFQHRFSSGNSGDIAKKRVLAPFTVVVYL